MEELIDAFRRLIFGYTDEEKKEAKKTKEKLDEKEEEKQKKKKKRNEKDAEEDSIEEEKKDLATQVVGNWLPLVLVGVLFFFVIKD